MQEMCCMGWRWVGCSFSPLLALPLSATFVPSANFHTSTNKNEGGAWRGAQSSVQAIKSHNLPWALQVAPSLKRALFQQRKATSEGSCTYLTAQLGITVLHRAELLERRRSRRSLLEMQAKGVLQWCVCKCNPWVTAAKAQCNYKGFWWAFWTGRV